jgi:hypothetical protein
MKVFSSQWSKITGAAIPHARPGGGSPIASSSAAAIEQLAQHRLIREARAAEPPVRLLQRPERAGGPRAPLARFPQVNLAVRDRAHVQGALPHDRGKARSESGSGPPAR